MQEKNGKEKKEISFDWTRFLFILFSCISTLVIWKKFFNSPRFPTEYGILMIISTLWQLAKTYPIKALAILGIIVYLGWINILGDPYSND
ncbi:MAG: hypothetical protein KBD53_00800 [Candidatus Omnitrophica bacterium]|nr:hypothetical protein [Candidatus Omnitrophota bacterium]